MQHRSESRDRRSITSLGLLLLGVAGLVLTACSSTREAEGTRARIALRQFTDNADSYELRSESHTDRLEYYSSARDEANVKIMRDDLMEALLRGFDDAGYAEFARPGAGPQRAPGDRLRKVIEVERDGTVTHVAMGLDSPRAEADLMRELVNGFFTAFNQIRSYQTLDTGNDDTIFVGPGN